MATIQSPPAPNPMTAILAFSTSARAREAPESAQDAENSGTEEEMEALYVEGNAQQALECACSI
jgi:hypothetical protein